MQRDVQCLRICLLASLLGTPTEECWPGVTSYQDFKASFPKWVRDYDARICANMSVVGLDLLEMMLVYDPSTRISAKQALNHPYFTDGAVGNGQQGYQNGFQH